MKPKTARNIQATPTYKHNT